MSSRSQVFFSLIFNYFWRKKPLYIKGLGVAVDNSGLFS